MKRKDAQEYLLKFNTEFTPPVYNEFFWKKAICRILLGDLIKAQLDFKKSFCSMQNLPMFWKKTGQPDQLAEIYILSCEFGKKEELLNALLDYRNNDKYANSSNAHRAYGLIGLLYPQPSWVEQSIAVLTAREKYKTSLYIGLCIQSIVERNINSWEDSIYKLLDEHKKMAKHGSLRGIPEGWLCMPALALAYLAEKSYMKICIVDEYYSQSYIDFMISYPE